MESLDSTKKVKDVMQKKVATVRFDAPLDKIIEMLKTKEISGVVVIDNIGEFVGIISILDVFKIMREENAREDAPLAEEIMTPYAITALPDETIKEAALKLLENSIHRLIVVESPSRKKPVGIVTSKDLIRGLYSK